MLIHSRALKLDPFRTSSSFASRSTTTSPTATSATRGYKRSANTAPTRRSFSWGQRSVSRVWKAALHSQNCCGSTNVREMLLLLPPLLLQITAVCFRSLPLLDSFSLRIQIGIALSDRLKTGPKRDTEAKAGKAAAAPHAVRRTGRNAAVAADGRTDGRGRRWTDKGPNLPIPCLASASAARPANGKKTVLRVWGSGTIAGVPSCHCWMAQPISFSSNGHGQAATHLA